MNPIPPVFLQLLADRNGIPAGLVFSGAQDACELPEELAELATRLPCHFREQVSEALAEELEQAGWRRLPTEQVLRADSPFDKNLPPNVAWVEGDWSMAPPAKPVGNQAASRALALQLVALVTNDADTHEIEALLRRDPTLSYHLLKLVNSLGMGTGRRVTSFSQAILILGRQQLRRWLNLMLFAAREGDVRSAMLLARVSVRARSMELLARETGLDKHNQEQAFMVGMFSLLGVLFGLPLNEVLAPLNIGDAAQQALLNKDGELGTLLALVEAAEQGDFAAVLTGLDEVQLSTAEFNAIIAEANLWMLNVTSDVTGRTNA